MEKVVLKPLYHRNKECIGIYASPNPLLNSCLQHKTGARWSKTNKCWYVPREKSMLQCIKHALKAVALVDARELTEPSGGGRKNIPDTRRQSQSDKLKAASQPVGFHSSASAIRSTEGAICAENREELRKYFRQLALKSYSQPTVRTYVNEFTQFLHIIGRKPANEFTVDRIKDYLQYCYEQLRLSENTLHSRINALKFYYEQVLGREKFFWDVPRPKKPYILPKVLAEDEVGKLFNAVTNLKHKAMLFTAYRAGLRVSEIVNLKLKDIDSGRMQIFIERAKGKKDRYAGLSIILLDVLRSYLRSCKPMPRKFLFENPALPGEPYSIRSVQAVFHKARVKAGINKKVSFHSLRHSFATHMLEKGVDIRYIKDLLGHFSIKTTERYLHVKKETLVALPNVLDELNAKVSLKW